jgi:hypothetical protein
MFAINIKRNYTLPIILVFLAIAAMSCGRQGQKAQGLAPENSVLGSRPYRVLIIIGDQWTDPQSYAIDGRRVKGEDFLDVVNMLKVWGVPFDILRLDQQRLQINRFLDGEAKPNYSCIIWMADPEKLSGASADYKTLKKAVNEYGISLLAMFDYIANEQIASQVGVNYQGVEDVKTGRDGDKFLFTGDHFISRNAKGISLPDSMQLGKETEDGKESETTSIGMIKCSVAEGSIVLASVGDMPQAVVKEINGDTKAIWIGGGRDWFRKYPVMRQVFRKALVYSIGYGLFNDNFENGFIFIMDDIGCADHSWFLRWHYPTPAKDTLIKYLIEPLEKRGLMMVQCITSGFIDLEKKMIVPPWTVKPFTDIYGNRQDYRSSYEGLKEGLKREVFEIQHDRAWSHMNWDLDSPPGPFWDSPLDSQKNNGDWYNEVSDVVRGNVPVPLNDLLFIYKTGIDAVKKAFGVTPIDAEIYPSSDLSEGTHTGDNNGRVAAMAGLGVGRDSYVGMDHTIEFKMMLPEQFTCHDLDLTIKTDGPSDPIGEWSDAWPKVTALSKEQLLKTKIAGVRSVDLHNQDWIESRKDKHWMGYNEMCAYLHAELTKYGTDGLRLFYDNHYCNHFEKKPSFWTLELSDEFRKKLGDKARIQIDGQTIGIYTGPVQKLQIPPGSGIHSILILTDKR